MVRLFGKPSAIVGHINMYLFIPKEQKYLNFFLRIYLFLRFLRILKYEIRQTFTEKTYRI